MSGKYTREDLVAAAKNASLEMKGPLSSSDFTRITGISQYHIYKLFPEGGWTEVQRLAGIELHPRYNQPLSDEELITECHRISTKLGHIPTWAVFNSMASISSDVVRRRFGGLQGTLAHYREWLLANEPDSPVLEILSTKSRHEIPSPPTVELTKATSNVRWSKVDATVFGAPMDFRGLRHAPINEQGVVFLFGMISYELGFIVEAIHASFPDCEAKRLVDSSQNRWQRALIEFEYQSSNFKQHGHDPSKCDLIVCWDHDWKDCPLEVIELRTWINQLDG
jgi:hypothetical protein